MKVHNYSENLAGAKLLENILESKLDNFEGRPLHEILNDNMISLYIEPGVSLVKESAIVATRVIFEKNLPDGQKIVGLGMKKQDILINDNDMFIDPSHYLIGKREDAKDRNIYGSEIYVWKMILFTDIKYI